ncbi:MAG: cyclic pyranopterin monophosphate synthase MoaC [Conexivisphaerales archaeon]
MARMVDISSKEVVRREAVAEGFIKLKPNTIEMVRAKKLEKGDAIEISKIAGIMAAKKTSELLPLCHNIPLEEVELKADTETTGIRITARVLSHTKTGVEMEALTAVTIALLTVWDVVKKYEKDENGQYPYTALSDVRVVRKTKEV